MFTTSMLLATLIMAGQRPPTPPPRAGNAVPDRVEIVIGEPGEDMTYEPARDQHRLKAPKSWCLTARPNEPLLQEARRTAAGRDASFVGGGILALNNLPNVPAASVRVVREQSVCEAAVKVFDRLWFAQGNANIETHTTFEPVLVIEVGPIYLIGLRREPDEPYAVMVLDHQMEELNGSYGAGL